MSLFSKLFKSNKPVLTVSLQETYTGFCFNLLTVDHYTSYQLDGIHSISFGDRFKYTIPQTEVFLLITSLLDSNIGRNVTLSTRSFTRSQEVKLVDHDTKLVTFYTFNRETKELSKEVTDLFEAYKPNKSEEPLFLNNALNKEIKSTLH